jgi:DegV family protein with EDD domain
MAVLKSIKGIEQVTKIIVDSTCDLPDEFMARYDIRSLPLKVLLNGKEYLDKVTIQVDDVYEAMRQGIVPKTSLPNPVDIFALFDDYCTRGHDFIYLAFSSLLSGTYEIASAVIDEMKLRFPEIKMQIIDTRSGSTATGLIALQAARMSDRGKSFDTIVGQVYKLVDHVEHIFTLTDLKWLTKGGRLNRSAAMLGNILNIKPILQVNDGIMEVIGKVRGRKNAINTIVDIVEARISDFPDQIIGISHADDLEGAQVLSREIDRRLGAKSKIVNKIGSVLGSHLGIGGLGVFFFNKKLDIYIND